MCRIFYVFCMLVLLGSIEYVYAQATVPVTIILQGSEPASSELRVNPTELEVAQSSIEDLEVWLSLRPEGRVTVSLLVTNPPPSGNAADIILSPISLSFEVDKYAERQSVEVRALSVAEPGEYTIELTASGGGVTDTETVTVTVIDGLGFQPLRRVELYPGDSGTLHAILIGTPSPRRKAITVRATILESGWEAHLELDPTEWRYDLEDDIISQPIEVTAKDNAEPGVYRLVLTAFREGEPDVQSQGEIEILSNPCIPRINVVRTELNFGTWGSGSSGWVLVDATNNRVTHSSNMNAAAGEEATEAEFTVTFSNCENRCLLSVDGTGTGGGGVTPYLIGQSTRDRLRFSLNKAILARNGGRTSGGSGWAFTSGSLMPEDGDLTHYLGGYVYVKSNAKSDIYRGTVTVTVSCPNG